MKREVFERELKTITDISKEFGAKRVLLFGSCLEDIESFYEKTDISVLSNLPNPTCVTFRKLCSRAFCTQVLMVHKPAQAPRFGC